MSTGIGTCTCSFFLPDNKHRIYAGTFLANQFDHQWQDTCPIKQCDPKNPKLKTDKRLADLCKSVYTWDIFPDFDIFLVNEYGNVVNQLTSTKGYDAEGVLSPDGKSILFTSMRNGDLDLYLMNVDGTSVQQVWYLGCLMTLHLVNTRTRL
jgi:hypothetical protein